MNSTILRVFMGRYLAHGSKSLNTLLAMRDDFTIEDLTTAPTKAGTKRCKGRRNG